jgi:hypothetical protein
MIECTVPEGETIVRGDALCVIDFDTNNNRPTVKRATRDNGEHKNPGASPPANWENLSPTLECRVL